MRHYFLTVLLLLMCAAINKTSASECYFYHTLKKHSLVQKEGKCFIEYTELDPNGITIAQHQLTALRKKFRGTVKLINSTRETLIFADEANYYAVSVAGGNDYKVLQLAALKDIEEIIDGRILVYKNGKVQCVNIYPYADDPEYKDLKNFPRGAGVITSTHDAFLLKADGKVLLYDIENDRSQIIPELDAKTVVFKPSPEPYEAHFLYDENTFYLLDDGLFSYTDVTGNFSGHQVNFLTMQYIVGDYLQQIYFKDTASRILWAYIKAGISEGTGESFYFYPLKNAAFVNDANALVHYNNGYYLSGWDAVYDYNKLNLNEVKSVHNIRSLPYAEYIYEDGVYLYRFDDDLSKFVRIPQLLSDEAVYYPAVQSYLHGTSAFYDDKGVINIITGDLSKIVKELPHRSPIKNLKIAYAFDDKLFIEDQFIPSPADVETITYLKSIADPVQPCDGGDGQIQVVVNYTYFFKDKNHYYHYQTGDKTLKKLTDIEAEMKGLDAIAASFPDSGSTGNVLSARAQLLIAGAALATAGAVIWTLKRK